MRRASLSGRDQVPLTVYIFNREDGWVCCDDGVNSRLRVFLALRIKKLGEGAERDPDRRVSGHEHASRQDQTHDLFRQLLLALAAGELQGRLDLLLDHCAPFPMKSMSSKKSVLDGSRTAASRLGDWRRLPCLAWRLTSGVRPGPRASLKLTRVSSQHVDELLGVDWLRGVTKQIHHVGHVFFIEPDSARLGHSIPRRHQSSSVQESAALSDAAITCQW